MAFKIKHNGRVYVDRSTVIAMLDHVLDVGDGTYEDMHSRMEGRVYKLIADLDSERAEDYA